MKIPFRRFVINIAQAHARQVVEDPRAHVDVPCGKCAACCRTFNVEVSRKDVANEPRLKTRDDWHMGEPGYEIATLQRHPDGTCVHLTDKGCEVYAQRPISCRTYDCRMNAAMGYRSVSSVMPEHMEALTKAYFYRLKQDIERPKGFDKVIHHRALEHRDPKLDVGVASLQGMIAMTAMFATDGDARAKKVLQELLDADDIQDARIAANTKGDA
jgi:Fe-S-cluster containining protein